MSPILRGIIAYNISHHIDHMPIFSFSRLSLELGDSKPSIRPRLCLNNDSIRGFEQEFRSRIGDSISDSNKTAKDSFHTFITLFKELYDKWFLHENNKKCNNPHTKKDWITVGVAKSCESKDMIF